jgi:hypothetical protein
MRFEEASFDETHMAMQRDQSVRSSEQDKNLIVLFTEEPWHDKAESAKEGRPIYRQRDFVMIMVPGDKDSIVKRPATQIDIDRFPMHFQRYKNKQEQRFGSGTPLRAVAFLSASQAKELEFFNVYTVEQLAAIPDIHAQKFMGIHNLKKLANDYLTIAREQAPMTSMREEMEKKDQQIAAQAQAIEEMGQRLKALEDKTEAA